MKNKGRILYQIAALLCFLSGLSSCCYAIIVHNVALFVPVGMTGIGVGAMFLTLSQRGVQKT